MAKDLKEVKTNFDFHPQNPPIGFKQYELNDLTDNQQTKLNDLKWKTIRENIKYLTSNIQEIRGVIIFILRLLLKHRPHRNINKFIANYFEWNSIEDIKDELTSFDQLRREKMCKIDYLDFLEKLRQQREDERLDQDLANLLDEFASVEEMESELKVEMFTEIIYDIIDRVIKIEEEAKIDKENVMCIVQEIYNNVMDEIYKRETIEEILEDIIEKIGVQTVNLHEIEDKVVVKEEESEFADEIEMEMLRVEMDMLVAENEEMGYEIDMEMLQMEEMEMEETEI